MKRIAFRVDGNESVGSGHIMRCLSIANASRELGAEVLFITADKKITSIIMTNNFKSVVLDTNFAELELELESLKKYICSDDILVIDSYFVTQKYLSELKNLCTLVYIDDMAQMPYPVDILINYNIYAGEINYNSIYKSYDLPKLLLGATYVPLREEFSLVHEKKIRSTVKNVLVSTGGADAEHIAIRFALYINENSQRFEGITFNFVVGKFSVDLEKLKILEAQSDRIKLFVNVKNISKLMKEADIAISAAGSTLYELCACAVPTVTYVFADNQSLGERTFSKKNIMLSGGDIRKEKNFEKNIFDALNRLIEDVELRETISKKMYESVDIHGAKKISKILLDNDWRKYDNCTEKV